MRSDTVAATASASPKASLPVEVERGAHARRRRLPLLMFELLDTPVLFAAVDAVEVLRALPAALPPAPVVSPFYDHPWGFKAREDLTRRGTDLWRYKRHRHRRRAVDRRRPRGAKPATG